MEQIPLKWDGNQCGIYCIRNLENDKIYIGSSKNCYHRVRSQHFDKLQRGVHTNPHLQASWNKYGKLSFDSFCLEICEIEDLESREQKWIDKMNCLDNKYGYNINPYTDRVELTLEQCEKISQSKLGKTRSNKPNPGVTYDGEKWIVRIGFRGVEYYLGRFNCLADAKEACRCALKGVREKGSPDTSLANSLRSTNKKTVVQKTMDGKIVRTFPSLASAEIAGYSYSGIWRYMTGKNKHYKSFLWEYI